MFTIVVFTCIHIPFIIDYDNKKKLWIICAKWEVVGKFVKRGDSSGRLFLEGDLSQKREGWQLCFNYFSLKFLTNLSLMILLFWNMPCKLPTVTRFNASSTLHTFRRICLKWFDSIFMNVCGMNFLLCDLTN